MPAVNPPTSARELLAPNGELHAAINIGNAVLAGGTIENPTGVTVDIAGEMARLLDATPVFHAFVAAKDSFASLISGESRLGFMAIEPVRAEKVAFTEPYVLIEGVYVVGVQSEASSPHELDRPGIRIGVKEGSAYDLFLTRTLQHAELVRGAEGVDVYLDQGLDAGAGIRQPVDTFASQHEGQRVIAEAFMQIRQAVALPKEAPSEVVEWTDSVLDELKASGFLSNALAAYGHTDVTVAPPR